MTVELNSTGLANAKALIAAGKVNKDSAWSFAGSDGDALLGSGGDKESAAEDKAEGGEAGDDWTEYARWFLGEDTAAAPKTKERYKYPFGKNGEVYRSAITAIRQRSSQQGATAIFDAAGDLLDSIDGKDTDKDGRGKAPGASRSLRVGQVFRELRAPDSCMIDPKLRTARIPFSSEAKVRQFFGDEILSHDPSAVRMGRMTSGGAPFLWNHDRNHPIGMIDGGYIGPDKRGYADIRFFKTDRGEEAMNMWNQGLRNVSTHYDIHEVEALQRSEGDGFRVTDWEPLEVSMVSIPADASVGGGRAAFRELAAGTEHEVPIRASASAAVATAVRDAGSQPQAAAAASTKGTAMSEVQAAAGATAVTAATDGTMIERLRGKGLEALKRNHQIPEDVHQAWVDQGKTVDEAARECLDIIAERAKKGSASQASRVGMSDADVERYSVSRALRACVDKSWPKVAPFEAEISKQIAQRMGKQTTEYTFFVPLEVQQAQGMARGQRDLNVATNTLGGYLVATQVQGFIDLLRNRSVLMRMGATVMSGLTGSVSIPKLTGAATAYWFASEAGTATESTPTFGQLALTPHTVGGYVEVSRQLLLQTAYQADAIINGDLARVVGLAVDLAGISGPGTAGQPTGITGVTGVGTANPGTTTNLSYADMIRFQTTVAASNAFMPGFGYVTTPTVAGALMGKPRFTNSDTPIWQGNILDGQVVGAPAMTSLQVGSGTVLAGDFSQVVIGEWGVLEIEANPYAQFQAGIVGIRALYTVDVGVRYGAAFALGTGFVGP
jgi:HK97 family phage major capsid protein